jgi:hypothetical protein
MVEAELEVVFPALKGQPYLVTSPVDDKYNCVAFAAGDTQNWWWPDEAGEDYWPVASVRAQTVETFRACLPR